MSAIRRHDGRRADQLRPVTITTDYVPTADGSCLIAMGQTRVICTASIADELPDWLAGSGRGWVTAEYGMLPASTGQRKRRPIGKPDSRATEIQRLIGRALRAVVDLSALGERSITLDCDVLTADGGTRTASITGAQVAMELAVAKAARAGVLTGRVVTGRVAAVSVGIVAGRAVLDLDYAEDASADVDMNVAMTGRGAYVEIQGTSERAAFGDEPLQAMLALARKGIRRLLACQRQALGAAPARGGRKVRP